MDQEKSTTESALQVIAGLAATPFIVWSVVHSILSRTLEDSVVSDSFSPIRADWVEKRDAYLRR